MKQQTSLMSPADIYYSSPTPAVQQPGLTSLKSTRSSRLMRERAVEAFQRVSWGAVITGSAIQYTGVLYTAGAQFCKDHPGCDALLRPALEKYAQGAAGQIEQFFKW